MNNNNVLNECYPYLDIAYSSREQRNVTLWANNQYGSLVDLNNENILRFVHYDEQHDKGGKMAITRNPHSSKNESECPIVAAGIVVYWLKEHKGSRGVNEIFEDYYNLCLNHYIAKEKKSFDAVGYDLKKEFAQSQHRDREWLLMDYSEKLYPYLNKDDIKQIKQLYTSYYKFVREKLRILYPPQYTSGHEREEAFLRTYRGAAQFCLNWVCHEHHLSATLETRNPLVDTSKRNQKEYMRKIRWEMNNYEECRFYEDLVSVDSKLMQEINTNLGLCQNQEARVRYVIQMLSSFKDFAQPFYPLNNNKEHTENAIQHLQRDRSLVKLCMEAAKNFHYDVPSVEHCLFVYWADMQRFYNKLAALLLSYKINLMDIQKKCGIYLTDQVIMSDYVDKKYIPDEKYAQQLLDEIEANKPKSKTISETETSANEDCKESDTTKVKIEETNQKEGTDFELLKDWKDDPDLDYYLSDEHWNHHVNHLLYIYLKNRYKGNEVGIYINLVLLNGSTSFKIDYNQIYGVMFNEAYSFCSYVLKTKVPATKIPHLEKSAAGLCNIELAAPIISYHILVMTGLILSFSDVKNEAVGKFLNCLSTHNSTHFFGEEFHHFEDYIKVGLDIVAAIMIDSRLQPGKLRLGYDYKDRDEYLRKTIPWYRVCAEKYEKQIQESENMSSQPMKQETAMPTETETKENINSAIPTGAEAEEYYIISKYDHFVEAVKKYKFSECPKVACLNEKQRGQLVRRIVNRHDNYGAYAIAMLCELDYDKWMMDNFAKDYPFSKRGLTKTAIFEHWKDALSLTNQRAIAGNYNVIRNPNGREDRTIYKASEYTIIVHDDYMEIKNSL